MHLKLFKLKRVVLIKSIFLGFLVANELPKEILSKDRLEIFDLTKQQIKEDSSKLRKDWIAPITYRVNKSYENQENYNPLTSTISVNQPIFKSGGIYQALHYANSVEKFSNLNLEQQKRDLIKEAIRLLFEIYKIKLNIKKQELLVKNSEIEVLRRKEEVLSGMSDTSFLNNAILDANANKNSLADLIYQKEQFINDFNSLSNRPYHTFEPPKFTLISSRDFIKGNLNILKIKEDIVSKDYLNLLSISKYLPEVNFTYNYTKYHDDYNRQLITLAMQNSVGLNLTIPFDTRFLNDIQSTKIEYLKSKISLSTTTLEEQNFYKTALFQIKTIETKKSIAQDDFELYNSLLDDIIQAANAGLNTYADVQTLQNSKEIRAYDVQILEIDRQIELLELYAKQMSSS